MSRFRAFYEENLVPTHSPPQGSANTDNTANTSEKSGEALRIVGNDSIGKHHKGPNSPSHAWTAQDWQDVYEERAAILEHDDAIPRKEAEHRAFDEAVSEYLVHVAPEHTDPSKCLHCRQERRGRVIPFVWSHGDDLWVHAMCGPRWKQERYAYAVKQLKDMGVGND